MKLSKLSRVWHRWGSIIVLLPITIIIVSGIVLQLKKEFATSNRRPSVVPGQNPQSALSAFSR